MIAADRVALVTGTSAGIGGAVARQLLARGLPVIALVERDDLPAFLEHRLGRRA